VDAHAAEIAAAHRALDAKLGRFLAAASSGEHGDALGAIVDFDDALRLHTTDEEDRLPPLPPGARLIPAEAESEWDRLAREIRLEHVQLRELSGMMRRLVEESGDLEGARRLFPNFARRWDAHTLKEERALAGGSGYL
jgi:Hemerythrin HHE cation binding domain